ncbi:MAG: glycosyltransferase family 9 protein [Verrucomicrobia bacterium]|nr:glycosyltransferase family 9 protein [Verrucomicrobiota bacterium]
METKKKRILVLLLAGAGDTLMTTPMLRELKACYPDAQIDALVMQGPSSCEVLAGHPAIHDVHFHHFLKESLYASLRKCLSLRRAHYDCVLVPMPHNRLAYNIIAFLIGGRVRIGFEYAIKCGAMSRVFFTKTIEENDSLHLVENNLRVITEGFGKPLSENKHTLELHLMDEHYDFATEFLNTCGLQQAGVIAIHAGSGTTKNLHLKRWPAEKWAALVAALSQTYNVGILVLGGPDEVALKHDVIARSGLDNAHIASLDEGSVLDMAALIAKCKCVISCDTLVPHVSAAVGTPVAVIYGPTSPVAAYPYSSRFELVRTHISCSPCYGFSRHGIKCHNPEFLKCLKDIEVDHVLASVQKLLAEPL